MHDCAKIASGLYLEGLCVDHARGVIWYSDVIGGGIHGVRPDGTPVCSFNAGRQWTGGVMMNADGAVLSSGEGGIMWNHPESGRSGWLLRDLDGHPINGINEMVPDGTGGIIFGTLDIENVIKGEPARPTALWRLAANRQLILLADGIGFTNGLMLDRPRARFYCNETFAGTLAFDVTTDLRLDNRHLLLEKEDADGMALDSEGTLWITGFRSAAFTRISSTGERLADWPAPASAITQLRFGGEDGCDAYFTSVPADGGDTLKEGGQITRADSHLFRARAPVPGLKLEPARFILS